MANTTLNLQTPITMAGVKKAAATAVVSDGTVTSVVITDGGAGYSAGETVFTFAAPSISFTGSGVGTGTDTITLSETVFSSGDLAQYSAAGNAIGGLSAGQSYYVFNISGNSVQLAETATAAAAGSAIDITSLGSGTHFLIGETASGVPTIDAAGAVIGFSVTDGGNGYTAAPAVTVGTPDGATSTAVVMPDSAVINIVVSGSGDGAVDIKGSIDGTNYVTVGSASVGEYLMIEHPMKYVKAEETAYSTGEYIVKGLF